jgi:hypothetical protein
MLVPAIAWADASLPSEKRGAQSPRQACIAELERADRWARSMWSATPPSEGIVVGDRWTYRRGGAMPKTRFDLDTLGYITAETIVDWPEGGQTYMTVSFLPDRVPGLVAEVTGWQELPLSPSYYDHLHLVRTHGSGSGQIWIRSSGRPIVFPRELLERLATVFENAIDRCALKFPDR